MKKFDGWIIPEMDSVGIRDITREWQNKGSQVLSMLENKRTVIQAGGNVGVFPVNLSKYFSTVHTFEPVDFNYECLILNTKNYNNIICHQKGLSNRKCSAEITYIADRNCGAIRLTESNDGISIDTIDSYGFTDVDLMWLDVEGFEFKILEGAKDTIKKNLPLLVLENNGLIHEFPSDPNGSQEFRDHLFSEYGYVFVKRLMRDDIFIHKTKRN